MRRDGARGMQQLGAAAGPLFALALLLPFPARATDPLTELPTSGLVFTGLSVIQVEREDIVLGIDKVRITYLLRNTDTIERTKLVAFPLPDIDMAALDGATVAIPSYDPSNPTNFLGFWTLVDGKPVQPEVVQRALALGIADVTATLEGLDIPLYPFAPDVLDRLNALSPEQKQSLAQRSIGHFSDDEFLPLWTLRTGFFWQQAFPQGRAVTVQHGYQPVVGGVAWSAENAPGLTQRFCLDKASLDAIERRSTAGQPPSIYWLTFQAGHAAYMRGSVANYTVTIEKPADTSIVSTCAKGFKPSGPTTLTMSASGHIPEDDIHVLFVE